jgi:hypothetical protein
MFGFLKSRQKPVLRESVPAFDAETIGNQQYVSDLHRELVRGVFDNMLRMRDIAPDALVFDLFPLLRLSGENDMHVQLTLLKWSEELLFRAPMLQHQMQIELGRYASPMKISTFVVGWRFGPACLMEATARNKRRQAVPSQFQTPPVGTPNFLERRRVPRMLQRPGPHASVFAPDPSAVSFAATELSPIK